MCDPVGFVLVQVLNDCKAEWINHIPMQIEVNLAMHLIHDIVLLHRVYFRGEIPALINPRRMREGYGSRSVCV